MSPARSTPARRMLILTASRLPGPPGATRGNGGVEVGLAMAGGRVATSVEVGRGVDEAVAVGMLEAVAVGVLVAVAVGVGVAEGVLVAVAVEVSVGVGGICRMA